jgi:predicted metal-dependent peptidase
MSDDAFDALDKALDTLDGVVDRIAADKRAQEAAQAVEDCRFRAVGERSAARAFFTSLALGLEPQVSPPGDEQTETAATDAKRIVFNPEWVLGLTPEERYGVVIGHEPMHCAMEHFARMLGMEDAQTAQIAADLEINPICRDAGFTLPPGALFPGEGEYANLPLGKTMEEYYALLQHDKDKQQPEQGQGGDGLGQQDPGGCGGVMPAPDKASAEQAANSWKGKVASAAQSASKRGDLPGELQRWIDRVLKPRVDPWEILRDYMTRAAKTEQSWARVNRRHLARGLYLPSRYGEELGDVVLLVDTSGSMDDEQIARIAGFLEEVLAANPGRLTVIYHDYRVQGVASWTPDDGPLELHPVGGGGTSHVPAFQEIANRMLEPSVILAATDLETRFPDDPGIPTIWVGTEDNGLRPPFGQYVCIA